MDAVEHAGSRKSAITPGGAQTVAPRKSVFARFVDALKETRRREAERVIASYTHLLAGGTPPDEDQREKP